MTDWEILTKAIEKALANGFLADKKMPSFKSWTIDPDCYGEESSWGEIRQLYKGAELYGRVDFIWYSVAELLFDHDFAKALWGYELIHFTTIDDDGIGFSASNLAWQYHLRNMVLAGDPIKYLGENL